MEVVARSLAAGALDEVDHLFGDDMYALDKAMSLSEGANAGWS